MGWISKIDNIIELNITNLNYIFTSDTQNDIILPTWRLSVIIYSEYFSVYMFDLISSELSVITVDDGAIASDGKSGRIFRAMENLWLLLCVLGLSEQITSLSSLTGWQTILFILLEVGETSSLAYLWLSELFIFPLAPYTSAFWVFTLYQLLFLSLYLKLWHNIILLKIFGQCR